jgi:hypothetical protein
MRALPRSSRITVLAVCLAAAVAAILVIGCMRVMDTSGRTSGQPGAPAATTPATGDGPQAVAARDATATPQDQPSAPSFADTSVFAHMADPLAARLFVLPPREQAPDASPSAVAATGGEQAAEHKSTARTAPREPLGPAQAEQAPDPAVEPKPAPRAIAAESAAPAATTAPGAAQSPPRSVLVVGDSFAVGIGMTMAESLRGAANIRLDQKGKTSSGLDNAKFHNWGKTLEGLLAASRPDALVIMIGGNDAQNGPGTEVWADNYRQKASDFLGIAARKNVPVYWVALPPMRDTGLNARVKTANTAMRAACQSGPNCRFIDAWDLFSDDKGDYAEEKTISGKTMKLRGKDGVHFTMTGYKLLSDRILAGFTPNLELSQKK